MVILSMELLQNDSRSPPPPAHPRLPPAVPLRHEGRPRGRVRHVQRNNPRGWNIWLQGWDGDEEAVHRWGRVDAWPRLMCSLYRRCAQRKGPRGLARRAEAHAHLEQ